MELVKRTLLLETYYCSFLGNQMKCYTSIDLEKYNTRIVLFIV